MPGWAPSTPASHEPAWSPAGLSSYETVSSPKYQTLPARSCAYQSNVSSTSSPPAKTWSWTTTVETPITVRRSVVTAVTVRSSWLLKVNFVPGTSGQYGLSTVSTKSAGSIAGVYATAPSILAGFRAGATVATGLPAAVWAGEGAA